MAEIRSFGASKDREENRKIVELLPEKGIQVDRENLLRESFPPGFKLGVGGAAAQIEGGWNVDGKGPSVWDTLCIENPEAIDDRSTTFVTCDAYGQWEKDVELLKELGCNSYKFSIAWSRILPKGNLSEVNEPGIAYYSRLIDALLLNNIQPLVVLWHFDLPTALGKKYDFKGQELIEHFVNYARLCFERFGNRVKYWITINEPWSYTVAGHDFGMHPPCLKEVEVVYTVMLNLAIAHAKIYRLYEHEFKKKYGGKVGISLDCFGFEPATNSAEDEEATQISFEFRFGLMASPLVFGKYPDCVRKLIDKKSIEEGRTVSRLPIITPELSALMKGTVDFFGLNHYSCEKVTASETGIPEGTTRFLLSSTDKLGFYGDTGTFHFHDPSWKGSATWWLKVTPFAIRSILNRIKKTYNNPEIMITENGFPDTIDRLEDNDRVNYLQAYLNETLKAVKLDGCNVTGYHYWAFLDCWEWTTGHDCTFGVIHVDKESDSKTRTPRASAKALKDIFKNYGFENFH